MKGTAVLKLGGELIENDEKLRAMGKAVARAAKKAPLVVIHGGGREIDAALQLAGIPKRQVDGLRVTDAATLDVVVAVLAGSVNTKFVAAINAAGGRAVGLTGADVSVAPVKRAALHSSTSGESVDLGFVGQPTNSSKPELVADLCRAGYVPVVASIGAAKDGQLFNVNADTLAGSLSARMKATRLVVAGATAGVLDEQGQTVRTLNGKAISEMVASGAATAGMVAKLSACRSALKGGVKSVAIVDGRAPERLVRAVAGDSTEASTTITK